MTEPQSSTQADFEDLVVPLLFDGAATAPEPVLIVLVGQAGAGSAPAGRLAESMWPNQRFVTINRNELAAMRSEWNTAVQEPFTAAARTQPGVEQWIDRALDHGREHHVSMVLDGASQDPAVVIGRVQQCAAAGYLVHVVVMAVPSPVSRLRDAARFYVEQALGGPGRWVGTREHDLAYTQTPMTVAAAQVTEQVQRLTVVDQNGAVLSDDHREPAGGQWVSAPTAAQSMVESRWKRPSPESANRWLTAHRLVLDIANQNGHNPATRETFGRLGTEATWTFESMTHPGSGVPPVLPMNPRFGPAQ